MKKTILVSVFLALQIVSFAIGEDKINCPFDFQTKSYNIHSTFRHLTADNIKTDFPCQAFLDSASWWSFQTIKSTFAELETVRKIDHNTANEVMRDCMVGTLLSKWNYTNLDSLELLQTVIEKYQSYIDVSPELADFFGEVSDNFGMYVANKLAEIVSNNKEIKSTFRFNYVVQHAKCLMYPPNIGLDNSEKVLLNLSHGNFNYLWDRFWNGTSLFVKSLIFLPTIFLLITYIYGFNLIIQKHFKTKIK